MDEKIVPKIPIILCFLTIAIIPKINPGKASTRPTLKQNDKTTAKKPKYILAIARPLGCLFLLGTIVTLFFYCWSLCIPLFNKCLCDDITSLHCS
ncbi:hypothetical protein [endosymbiont 'TC1' of Trimyema compressum]|uniref:hypothetical protein n=1 Tax=endosymbiont 'TC1' of Trimyema compressum TaxID=243899 RepID=UPI0013922E09|nr:hypothetical protein [endosymbiont 'TC1' of Trimyema compressum]